MQRSTFIGPCNIRGRTNPFPTNSIRPSEAIEKAAAAEEVSEKQCAKTSTSLDLNFRERCGAFFAVVCWKFYPSPVKFLLKKWPKVMVRW